MLYCFTAKNSNLPIELNQLNREILLRLKQKTSKKKKNFCKVTVELSSEVMTNFHSCERGSERRQRVLMRGVRVLTVLLDLWPAAALIGFLE